MRLRVDEECLSPREVHVRRKRLSVHRTHSANAVVAASMDFMRLRAEKLLLGSGKILRTQLRQRRGRGREGERAAWGAEQTLVWSVGCRFLRQTYKACSQFLIRNKLYARKWIFFYRFELNQKYLTLRN